MVYGAVGRRRTAAYQLDRVLVADRDEGADIVAHMTQAAARASAFYMEVARNRRLWTIKDANGFPAPQTSEGRAMPFWSSKARVERVITSIPAYAGFSPVELSWEVFRDQWLPGLEQDGIRVGVNWAGDRAVGYDLPPREILANLEYAIAAAKAE